MAALTLTVAHIFMSVLHCLYKEGSVESLSRASFPPVVTYTFASAFVSTVMFTFMPVLIHYPDQTERTETERTYTVSLHAESDGGSGGGEHAESSLSLYIGGDEFENQTRSETLLIEDQRRRERGEERATSSREGTRAILERSKGQNSQGGR